MTTADSAAVRHPRLWDTLSEAGRDSVVIGVPQTYPVRPLKGQLVSCLLTPNTDSLFTYPAMLKQEVPFDLAAVKVRQHLVGVDQKAAAAAAERAILPRRPGPRVHPQRRHASAPCASLRR